MGGHAKGIAAGDEVDVPVEPDTAGRVLDVPAADRQVGGDAARGRAREKFSWLFRDRMSFSGAAAPTCV
jgi:hypothetical protein